MTVDSPAIDDLAVDLVAVDHSSAIDVAVDSSDADSLELHMEQQWIVQSQSEFVVMVLFYSMRGG